MDGRRLEGKVAIVTGGATGIGEAISHKLAVEGARVVVNGLDGDPVDEVVNAIHRNGGIATGHIGDVSDKSNASGCVRAAIKRFGHLDILINNAGFFPAAAETQDFPLEAFDRMMQWNARSAFLMTKLALPHLQKSRGCVISAGSEAGELGLPHVTPYGATKGWMHAFMRGVAVEQAKYGVRANCVSPGPVDTAWTHRETGPMDEKMERTMTEATPLGRRATPAEVANVYCFLASDEASYVTGAVYFVDGGITAARGLIGREAEPEVREPPPTDLPLRHSREGLDDKDISRYT